MRYGLCLLFILIVFFGLIGCTDYDNKVIFDGNSSHWNGKIVIDKEIGVANLVLTPKNIHETDLRQIEVYMEHEKRLVGLEVEQLKKGEEIVFQIPEEIWNEADFLEVAVSWGSNYSEEFKLTSR